MLSLRKNVWVMHRDAEAKRQKSDTKHAAVLEKAVARRQDQLAQAEKEAAEKQAKKKKKPAARAKASKPKLSSERKGAAAFGSSPLSAARERSLLMTVTLALV